jgi:uncharacterized protein YfaT (DUF1175 family)
MLVCVLVAVDALCFAADAGVAEMTASIAHAIATKIGDKAREARFRLVFVLIAASSLKNNPSCKN